MSALLAPDARDVLLVIDVQNDFCPGGKLPVPRGHEVVPVINRLAEKFENVVLTQDWHPPGHQSFASTHPGRKPLDTIDTEHGIRYSGRIIACSTCGAALRDDSAAPTRNWCCGRATIRRSTPTRRSTKTIARRAPDLPDTCANVASRRIFLAGLAFDFCVHYSAEDAHCEGFEAIVIENACRGIDVDGSVAATRERFRILGIRCIPADAIEVRPAGA